MPPETKNAQTNLLTWLESASGQAALAALLKGDPLHIPAAAPLDPRLQAAAEAIANGRVDAEITGLVAQVKPANVEAALRAAQDRTQAFDAVAKPENQAIDLFDKLLSRDSSSEGAGLRRDFTAARLRFTAERYDAEARLNQAIANLYEVQVHLSNFTAERHR